MSKQRPCNVSLTARGGLFIDFNSVKLDLSRTIKAFYAAFSWGITTASSFSQSSLMKLA
jgi:hypothetical protein